MKPTLAPFPATRLRRMRQSPALRALSRQNTLTVDDLIWPVFVMDGTDTETPVASMPGVMRKTVDRVAAAAVEAQALGIPAICIFPYTGMAARTEDCAMAWDPENLTNQAIRAIKDAAPDIAVMTDIALDPYNINGHDGFVENGEIVNDRTGEALVKMAMAQADAGADQLGPSDMMDGRIGAIRTALEAEKHQNVAILSYTAKYASAF
jgi:porphobilinogen synthase